MHLIKLSLSERRALAHQIHRTKDFKVLKRAQALLWLSEGISASHAAKRLGINRRTIYYWVSSYQNQRSNAFGSRLQDRPKPGRYPRKSLLVLRELDALLQESPQRYGYHYTEWTASLLAKVLERDHHLDISTKTIRRCLKQSHYVWKRPGYALARQSPTWAQEKGGLKSGLNQYPRCLILFTDETLLTSIPPLRAKWALKGTQTVVSIIGEHKRQVLYGTMSLRGGLLIQDAPQCNQEEFQTHLCMIRSLWRGWKIVLFLDRAPSHTAEESIVLAEALGIALRWLPVACPKLNPMDHLWRHIKGDVLANCPYHSLDEGVTQIHQYLQDIGPAGWMRKAGLFSEKFWLREYCAFL